MTNNTNTTSRPWNIVLCNRKLVGNLEMLSTTTWDFRFSKPIHAHHHWWVFLFEIFYLGHCWMNTLTFKIERIWVSSIFFKCQFFSICQKIVIWSQGRKCLLSRLECVWCECFPTSWGSLLWGSITFCKFNQMLQSKTLWVYLGIRNKISLVSKPNWYLSRYHNHLSP
jgi:hypothetical protein